LFFHEDHDHPGKFKPQYLDRLLDNEKSDNQERFTKALNDFSDLDPFATASLLKPRMYLIRNCKNCECDPSSRISSRDASVVAFDPVKAETPDQDLSLPELEQACMIRPPVLHACNKSAVGGDGESTGKITKQLSYEMFTQDLKIIAEYPDDLINKVDKARADCNYSKIPLVDRIRDVQCDPKRNTQLPTDNEVLDCQHYADLIAK